MKALIISDIHSNVESLNAIWEKENDADLIFAAGDYVDYGTDPMAVIDWIRGRQVRCVVGNHDERLIRTWYENKFNALPPEELWWVHHNCQRMDQEHVRFLEELPAHMSFEMDGVQYLMQHSFIPDRYDNINSQYHFDRYWEEHSTLSRAPGAERRMIFGHSHRQLVQRHGGDSLWMNPGSTSYRRPDDPNKDAYYIVIENGKIDMRHTPYNREPLLQEAIRARPFMKPEEWSVAWFFFGKTLEDGPDVPLCKCV